MIEQAQRLGDCYRLHARSGRLGQVLDQPPADSIIAVGAADAHHPDAAAHLRNLLGKRPPDSRARQDSQIETKHSPSVGRFDSTALAGRLEEKF